MDPKSEDWLSLWGLGGVFGWDADHVVFLDLGTGYMGVFTLWKISVCTFPPTFSYWCFIVIHAGGICCYILVHAHNTQYNNIIWPILQVLSSRKKVYKNINSIRNSENHKISLWTFKGCMENKLNKLTLCLRINGDWSIGLRKVPLNYWSSYSPRCVKRFIK